MNLDCLSVKYCLFKIELNWEQRNQIKHKNKTFIGLSVIVLGLLLNKWTIESFAPDKIIESASHITQILVVQLLLIFYGIYLLINKTILKRAVIVIIFLVPFLGFSIINIKGTKIFKKSSDNKSQRSRAQQSQAQIMLDRVIFLEENKVAELFQETGEILYSLHQSAVPLTFTIPEDGILDTAIGVEPLITNLFTGDIYFELSITLNDGDSKTIFRKEIDLSSLSEKEFIWQKKSIDLSKYSGREVTLYFNKGYKNNSQNKPKIVYDLLPIDFMYWRTPNIRPKKLKDKYNVILISLDTLRADHLHFMGYPRETSPNLDRLAQIGVLFTTVVSQAPWTTPSHFSIFTSTYPSVHQGNQPLHILDRRWNDTLPTMASILRDRGYVTTAFTGRGFISAKFGFYKAFDFYNESTSFEASKCISDVEPIFNKSMQWLNDNKDRTFFLFIHTYEPHTRYCDEFFVRQEGINNKSENIEYRTAKYDGDIRRADLFVGKLIEKLDELGLTDNTIIVITSDHGEDLVAVEHAHSLYDEVLLVPLIFYNPKIFPHGRRIDYQVRLIDILPTILGYLGYKEEPSFQGKSLKGMIEGYDQISRPAYSEATSYGTERESIRAKGYKYIHRISYGQLSHPYSWWLPLTPLHELYDLNVDPDEKINLAEKQKSKVEEYQKLILSIFPEKTFKDDESDLPAGSIDISKDKDLIEELKSLGYIQ